MVIHGGVKREDRRKVQELFRNDPVVRVLIATDAAGEGVNLQNANLMVNYDALEPNRIEQRLAASTVSARPKSATCGTWSPTRPAKATFPAPVRQAGSRAQGLGGRVFDILGEVFEEKSLRELLIEAIKYGEDPRARPSSSARSRARSTPTACRTSSAAMRCAKRSWTRSDSTQ